MKPKPGAQSSPERLAAATRCGLLIINADDWGRDAETTQRTLDCVSRNAVSAVSAMVFMADSVRAARISQENSIDTGLHLNLTTPFSGSNHSSRLAERQQGLISYLVSCRVSRVIYHPGLARAFEYVCKAQIEEFCRLYGKMPERIDGHHHMHLCSNVLFGGLLPADTIVRRNWTFRPGDKGAVNRLYRKAIDYVAAQRHQMADYLFALSPIEPIDRLRQVFSLAGQAVVEVEAHPVNPSEYHFLISDDFTRLTTGIRRRGFSALRSYHAVCDQAVYVD